MSGKLDAILGDIARLASLLWEKGWAERNAGNFSMDVTDYILSGTETKKKENATVIRRAHMTVDTGRFVKKRIPFSILAGRSILAKAHGARFRDIVKKPKEGMVLVTISRKLDGYTVTGGAIDSNMPTSEFPSHLAIHAMLRRQRRPQTAVLHTHPDELIALTHMKKLSTSKAISNALWSMHPEMKVVLPEGVGFVPYRLPGSETLAKATVGFLSTGRMAVWEKHGVVSLGRTPAEAFDLVDTANKSARIYLLCRSAGVKPEGLTPLQLRELERAFGL